MPAEPAATASGVLTESILGFVVRQAINVAAVLRIADLLVEARSPRVGWQRWGADALPLTEGGLKP